MNQQKKEHFREYAIAIVGGGPAGLTAALYAGRSRINHILLEAKPILGGQILYTEKIENYPGCDEPVEGLQLMQRFQKQAEHFGANIVVSKVESLSKVELSFRIVLEDGEVSANAVIICSGASPKKTGITGEDKFIGRGISFCAVCDAPLFKGKTVAVIGGGNSAIEEALYLSRFAEKVYVVHRRDRLRAAKILQERAFANEKIEIIRSHIPIRVFGDEVIGAVELESVKTKERRTVELDGIFEYIGFLPNTAFIKIPELALDEYGFIITDAEMRTNISGLFAAGDVRSKLLRQVSTAVGDGATAEFSAEKFIDGL